MNFSKGFIVKNYKEVEECFGIVDGILVINLSAEKYADVFKDLAKCLPVPACLAYDVPCNELKEKELRKSNKDSFHKEVYFLDGINHEIMETLIDNMGDILINDGLTRFAFCGLEIQEEVAKEKYNEVLVFANDFSKYIEVLKKHKIKEVSEVTTAMDTFSESNPGICQKYIDKNGRDYSDLLKALIKMGAYFDHIDENY